VEGALPVPGGLEQDDLPTQTILSSYDSMKKGNCGLLPHLIKGLISSAFWEGIYTAGCRALSIKASSDLVCSGTGSTVAASPQHSAHISPDVCTALLVLLPGLAWSFRTNPRSSTYCYSTLQIHQEISLLVQMRKDQIGKSTSQKQDPLHLDVRPKSLLPPCKQKNTTTWSILRLLSTFQETVI